jgi:hypothetical protein
MVVLGVGRTGRICCAYVWNPDRFEHPATDPWTKSDSCVISAVCAHRPKPGDKAGNVVLQHLSCSTSSAPSVPCHAQKAQKGSFSPPAGERHVVHTTEDHSSLSAPAIFITIALTLRRGAAPWWSSPRPAGSDESRPQRFEILAAY